MHSTALTYDLKGNTLSDGNNSSVWDEQGNRGQTGCFVS
jgi:hypothetical protein